MKPHRYPEALLVGLVLAMMLSGLRLVSFVPPALANSLLAGEAPQAVLLAESFDGVTFPPANWDATIVTGTSQGWSRVTSGSPPTATPHSGAGMAQFNSFIIPSGDSTRLYTPILNLAGQTAPALEFWMYHDTDLPSSDDRIQVQISTDGGTNYTTVLGTISRYDGSTGWKFHSIDLAAYSGQTNVRLGLLAISDFGNNMYLDDVKVGPPTTYSYVYLPAIIKPSPLPPDGHWTGTTSRGYPMSFDVSAGGTTWSSFTLKTDFALVGCSGTIETTSSGPGSIINNRFNGGSSTYQFSGQLTSLTTASGTYAYTNYFVFGCGYLTQSGTWTASRP